MEQLNQLAASCGIVLEHEMLELFQRYETLLLDWNQRMNLTAITQHEEICIKHFIDSLLVLKGVEIPNGATLLDIGTGAGFPGIPIRIARPDISITLMDSLNKRIAFLQTVCDTLGFSNVECLHGRAEERARDSVYREQFNIVTARAVASLPVLCEYCMPYVKMGGLFVAMKGPDAEEECSVAMEAIALLGGQVDRIEKQVLPNSNRRSLVLIRKISPLSSKYPRKGVKIAKSPLA